MSFLVNLGTDFVSVDAGSTTPLTFEVSNQGSETDCYEVTTEGVDPDWITLPSDPLSLAPGTTGSEKLLIRPHREPESAAGSYPFHIHVRSLNSGESRSVAVLMEIKPFHQLSLDTDPKRVVLGGFGGPSSIALKVLNLSNVEHQLQVFGTDSDARYNFQFGDDKFSIGPGQEREFQIGLSAKRKPLIASPRLDNLSFSVRSLAFPNVAAYSQVQVEQRPVLPTVPTIFALFMALLAFAWWSALPRAPKVDIFELTKDRITVGESVNVVYRVEGAKKITLKSSDGNGTSSVNEKGEWTYAPSAPGNYTVTMVAEGSAQTRRELVLVVDPAPVIPQPKIEVFDVEPRSIEAGGSFTVSYRFNKDVARATLQPLGYTIDITKNRFTFPPSTVGPIMLELIAENSRGDRVSQKIKVEVLAKSLANIRQFSVSPMTVPFEDARIQVSWSADSASKAVLKYEGKSLNVDPSGGIQELVLTKTGTVTLVVTDANGRSVDRSVKVEVLPAAEPPPTNSTNPPGDSPENTPPPTTTTNPPVTDPL